MATTKTTEELFSGNGSQTNFPFTIEYLRTSDIAVRISGVLQTETTDYSVVGTNIVFVTAPATGSNNIKITRITDIDAARSIYAAGSSIRAKDLNTNHDQILFKLQEKDTRIPASTTSNTPPTDAVSGDRWYDTVSGRSFIYYTDVDSSQWVEENPAFDADEFTTNITNTNVATNAAIAATKLAFTQTGGTQRTVASKFQDTISVKDFGAVGNGSNNDTTPIQNALNAAAGTANVFLPAGTYIVHDTILIPSNTYFYGAGENSIIKMQDNIDIVRSLILTGQRDQKRKNIVIEHMTLDFNRSRFTNTDGTTRIGSSASNQNDTEAKPTDPRINDGTVIGSPASTITVNTDLGGNNFQDINSSTLCICFSENVLVNNVKALNAYKHCIDVTSPKYRRSLGGTLTTSTPQIYDTVARTNATVAGSSKTITVSLIAHGFSVDDQIFLRITGSTAHDGLYDVVTVADANTFTVTTDSTVSISSGTACVVIQDQGCKNVIIQNCFAKGAGDDNITTHFSTDILITGCESRNPSGVLVAANTNCYEIDDGSRNVTISNCYAIGGCKGLQIKGHDYAPAPYNITVDGLRITNCAEGMDIKHTGWGELSFSSSSLGGGTITNPDHQIRNGSIAYSGGSPTAKNITISNVQIIAPRGVLTGFDKTLVKVDRQIQFYAYENAIFNNIMIQDGSFDLAGDAKPAISGTDGTNSDASTDISEVVYVYRNAKNVVFKNLAIMGFRNAVKGFRVTTSFGDHLAVDGFISQDGPPFAFEITGNSANPAATGQLDNYFIIGNHTSTSGSKGIRNTLDNFYIEGNGGRVTGYATNIDSAT